ncbi:hypothetical protein OUZ56_002649 [Daphnia magna]|uniref:Uncharacterized protein n=1 Tax=Daphnia magna TaxID=35525 RepID=A0ABR0A6S2_9CRUS|nr:hypothetical protein OUZ56_002649 [Daphnia magna]
MKREGGRERENGYYFPGTFIFLSPYSCVVPGTDQMAKFLGTFDCVWKEILSAICHGLAQKFFNQSTSPYGK